MLRGTSREKAVILPIQEYQRLLEDLHDLSVVAERREEYAISLDDMKKRLAYHASDYFINRLNNPA
jgi:hypothetical protein